jgi:hypothetical protein
VHPQGLLRILLEHVGDLPRQVGGEPAGDPLLGQLGGLGLRVALQLPALLGHLGRHLLVLRLHAGVLAEAHGDRSRHQAGDAGQHDRAGRQPAPADAGDQRDVGDQPVHRPERRRAQPAAGDVGVVVGIERERTVADRPAPHGTVRIS